jgi:hypothetical protein
MIDEDNVQTLHSSNKITDASNENKDETNELIHGNHFIHFDHFQMGEEVFMIEPSLLCHLDRSEVPSLH